MMSKRGDVPWILIALIIGIIFLLTVFITPGKKIPQTFQDFQAIERELRDQWNKTFTPPQRQLTSDDITFLRSYNSFIQQLQTCYQQGASDCMCKTSFPAPKDRNYKAVFTYDPKIGLFAYPISANGRTPLETLIVISAPMKDLSQRYCFASYLANRRFFTQRFDVFFDEQGRTVFSPPEQDVPHKGQISNRYWGWGTTDVYAYSFTSAIPIIFYKASPQELCLVNPDPAITSTYAEKTFCDTKKPFIEKAPSAPKPCEIYVAAWYNYLDVRVVEESATTVYIDGIRPTQVSLGFETESCKGKTISYEIVSYEIGPPRGNPQPITQGAAQPTQDRESIRIPITLVKPGVGTEEYEATIKIVDNPRDTIRAYLKLYP